MKNKTKHIILLTPGFPKNEGDSTTIPALQIYVKALALSNPNFNIKVIAFQYPFTLKKQDWFGVRVFPLNGSNKRYKKLFIWQKAKCLLEKIHRENPITILHSFWLGECALIGQKFAKTHNIKHVITAMGQDVNKNLFMNLFSKKFSKNTQIISLSKSHKKLLHKNYALNSSIISWGINPENFPKQQEKIIAVLGVGSLVEIKNFDLFIKIIAKLKKRIQHLKVEIIGDGDFKNQLIQEIETNKLQDIISLKGQLTRNEVLEKMAKAKVLLHTSSYESFGMVFLEALQSNMNIVSFDVGFAEESSRWFVCTSEDEMVEKLEIILNNYTNKINKTYINNIKNTVMVYCELYNVKNKEL